MNALFQDFLSSVLSGGQKRPSVVTSESWGQRRTFVAYDFDDDTFVFEEGIWDRLSNKDPVVIIPKRDLLPALAASGNPIYGNVLTVTSGNHAVAALPLLKGQFWDLAEIPLADASSTLRHAAVCCNFVSNTLEISQREVSTQRIVDADNWLQGLDISMDRVLLSDRVDTTLDEYRRRGQEWRIRPLAWTQDEMVQAIQATRHTFDPQGLLYYHNVKGVFFITLANLTAWCQAAASRPDYFRDRIRILVSPSPADGASFLRRPKFATHHEIEFFGVSPKAARVRLIPLIEEIYSASATLTPDQLAARMSAFLDEFRALLVSPELADESSAPFVESLYRNITGEVYQSASDTVAPAFDDRRSALPGATYFYDGSYRIHPSADSRTEAILAYLSSIVSHGDHVEYVNIYEVRSETDQVRLGGGKTREIVYKTAWNPLPYRLIEKRLSQRSTGYGTYTMTRVEAFRALGISYGSHRLLARHGGGIGEVHYFVRERYPGEPFGQLPASCFRSPASGDAEDPEIVTAILSLMGGAAAENLVMKKVSRSTGRSLFGKEGKEIVEFGYDVSLRKEMPLRVHLCSIRGTMGWPNYECSEENLQQIFQHYAAAFADVIHTYSSAHPSVPRDTLFSAFLDGFKAKTFEIHWNFVKHRAEFESYASSAFRDYQFDERWHFVLWSLEEQRSHLDDIAALIRQNLPLSEQA